MPADNKRMTEHRVREFMQWVGWASFFGAVIAISLWMWQVAAL